MEDFFRLYARLVQRYNNSQDRGDLAAVVLWQISIIEKARNYYRRKGTLPKIFRELDLINNDPAYADAKARLLSPGCALARAFPMFGKAGLI